MATKKHYTIVDGHFEADEGYWFRKADEYVWGRKLWLWQTETLGDWYVITDEERIKLEEEEKAEMEKLMNDMKATEANDENA
jgi:hypothetical protein